jgi:hypothetical protein
VRWCSGWSACGQRGAGGELGGQVDSTAPLLPPWRENDSDGAMTEQGGATRARR